jgi:hypothetical protein
LTERVGWGRGRSPAWMGERSPPARHVAGKGMLGLGKRGSAAGWGSGSGSGSGGRRGTQIEMESGWGGVVFLACSHRTYRYDGMIGRKKKTQDGIDGLAGARKDGSERRKKKKKERRVDDRAELAAVHVIRQRASDERKRQNNTLQGHTPEWEQLSRIYSRSQAYTFNLSLSAVP